MTTREARELWASELESGNWKQGTGQLARETDQGTEYCCLGVACELAVREGIIDGYAQMSPNLECYPDVWLWLGLHDYEGTYQTACGPYGAQTGTALVVDNDSGQPFEEIAATIRNEPEGLIT
jgi:hypothetical protein